MIYFVRHGQTDSNLGNVFTGKMEVPLNARGFEQAKQTANNLKDVDFDIAFVSPMTRALQTYVEISKHHKGLNVVVDERLAERDYTSVEGRVDNEEDTRKRWNLNYANSEEFGESINHLYDRVKTFLDEIKEKYCNKKVLIVAHNGVGRVVKMVYYGKPKSGDLHEYSMSNAGVEIFKG